MRTTAPSVIEPGMSYYMNYTLENTQLYKRSIINTVFNCILFLGFVSIIGGILVYSYKNKPSQEDRERLRRENTQRIIEKVRSLNHKFSTHIHNIDNQDDLFTNTSLITDLPPLKFI